MRPRYCRSADAGMRMQNALLLVGLNQESMESNFDGSQDSYT